MKNAILYIKMGIFNFLIVSILGTIIRLNMVYPIEYVVHKNFREAHSHFAFYGWVSALLYFFISGHLQKIFPNIKIRKYHYIIFANLIASYGMLFSFIYGGYFWLSIAFSCLALFSGFAYFFFIQKDTSGHHSAEFPWLRLGSFFALFSSIGVFSLAYLMASHTDNTDLHRASIYFYLHYQYNGVFLFSCIGLLMISLKKKGISISEGLNSTLVHLLFIGAFLGYILSILWLKNMPLFAFLCSGAIALAQIIGMAILVKIIYRNWGSITAGQSSIQKVILRILGGAILLKFIIQLASTLPIFIPLFDNINLVIGYLHLVLLVGISMFLIYIILDTGYFIISPLLSISLRIFMVGIIFNELILMVSGFIAIPYQWGPKLLLIASIIIVLGISGILVFLKKNNR